LLSLLQSTLGFLGYPCTGAAAMAFAAKASSMLQIEEVSFLTGSQLLVNYFNGPDLNHPPHWDAKPSLKDS